MTCNINNEYNSLTIEDGTPLKGRLKISGSKNAALGIMAASILCSDGTVKLNNLPEVADVLTLTRIIKKLGVDIYSSKNSANIMASKVFSHVLPLEDSRKMRASILVAGPLIARTGEAFITQPGGCVIGTRPIDLHLAGFQKFGVKITKVDNDYLKLAAKKLEGCKIDLAFPSVGATENFMSIACLAKGRTIINNAAKEPEIVDLAKFLKSMNAQISGEGTSTITVDGVDKLCATEHKIIFDRIEAGSFMLAAAITRGNLQLDGINPEHLESLSSILRRIGVTVEENSFGSLIVEGTEKYESTNVETGSYPGFPTDLQPSITLLLSLACGKSTITDTVFPKRFCYVSELNRMGTDIAIVENSAVVNGVKNLKGADVAAPDLRAGFALIIAGLVAKGKTTVSNMGYVDRGYENLVEKLRRLGADIYRSQKLIDVVESPKISRRKTRENPD